MTSLVTRSLALVLAALASACAVDSGTAPSNEPSPTREYRTGSNIPVKEPKTTTDEERTQAAEQLRQMQQGGASARP